MSSKPSETFTMQTETLNQDANSLSQNGSISDLVDSMSSIKMGDEQPEADDTLAKNPQSPPRRLVIYTRPSMLKLYKSPLVKPPDDMPALKDWFGYVLAAHDHSNIKFIFYL